MLERTVIARQREAPVLGGFDVVVAGGGSAGLAAAVSAARLGASVAIIERYGFFGGNAVSAYVGTICGLYLRGSNGFERVSHGFASEWADRLAAAGASMGPVPFKKTAVQLYVPWAFKRLADEMIRDSDQITAFLHSFVSDVYMEDGRIRGVMVATKQGPVAVMGKVFIDCTGDADVAFHAGEQVVESEPGKRQFPSMQFVIQNADFEKARQAAVAQLAASGEADFNAMATAVTSMLSTLMSEQGQQEPWSLTRTGGAVFPTFRPGEVIGAMTRVGGPDSSSPDLTDISHLTFAEMSGRDQAERSHAFLREHLPGFEASFLADTPTQIGIRETRRVEGRYVLTHEDVVGAARFDDTIGCGAWPEEMHWFGTGTGYVWLEDGAYYQMPYRMLLSAGCDNLLVAGRCASATSEANASCRVIATSMVQGQAAGTAAAMSVQRAIAPAELEPDILQKQLVEAGAYLG